MVVYLGVRDKALLFPQLNQRSHLASALLCLLGRASSVVDC
jgi:hypothetical protein